jgi:hypothetical protein
MVVEDALEGELDDHLGYARHDPESRDGGNSRNGHRAKTVSPRPGRWRFRCRGTGIPERTWPAPQGRRNINVLCAGAGTEVTIPRVNGPGDSPGVPGSGRPSGARWRHRPGRVRVQAAGTERPGRRRPRHLADPLHSSPGGGPAPTRRLLHDLQSRERSGSAGRSPLPLGPSASAAGTLRDRGCTQGRWPAD